VFYPTPVGYRGWGTTLRAEQAEFFVDIPISGGTLGTKVAENGISVQVLESNLYRPYRLYQ